MSPNCPHNPKSQNNPSIIQHNLSGGRGFKSRRSPHFFSETQDTYQQYQCPQTVPNCPHDGRGFFLPKHPQKAFVENLQAPQAREPHLSLFASWRTKACHAWPQLPGQPRPDRVAPEGGQWCRANGDRPCPSSLHGVKNSQASRGLAAAANPTATNVLQPGATRVHILIHPQDSRPLPWGCFFLIAGSMTDHPVIMGTNFIHAGECEPQRMEI